MLQNIRDKAQGWLAWVIVGLLIIPFALWGIQEYLGPSGKIVVAEVNQTEISRNQFEQAVTRQMQMFSQNFGQDISSLRGTIEKTVLNQIIEEEILFQQANQYGLHVGNQWLIAQIHAIPAFQKDKKFSEEIYQSVLARQGLTPSVFEQDYRRSLSSDQWRKSLLSSAVWSDADNNYYQAVEQQSRQISYVKLSSNDYKSKITLTDDELNSYYQTHKDRYFSEEQVSIEYVSLATNQLKDDLNITDEGLQAYYDEQINRFTTAARWKARHILVALPENADIEAETKAEAEVNILLEKITNSDYNIVETEWLVAEKEGGELEFNDWLTEESARPEIFTAIKDLTVGQTSRSVRTEFGFHIINIVAAEPITIQVLDEVKDSLLTEYKEEKARQLFYEQAEEFTNLAYENLDSLAVLADVLELTINSTDLFSRAGNDENELLKNPKILKAAFSAKVLDNENSEVIELDEQHYVLLRIKKHDKAELQDLDVVKTQVETQLLNDKSKQAVEEAGKALLIALEQGQDGQIQLDSHQVSWEPNFWIKRNNNTDLAIPSLANTAFKMGKLSDDNAAYQGLFIGNDYIVLALLAIKDGEVNTDKTAIAVNDQSYFWGESEFQVLLATMRTDTTISINAPELK